MARTVHSGVVTEIEAQELRATWAVDLLFDSGSLYFWGGIGTLSANGNTYTGTGNLGAVDGIEETVELKATGLRVGISGVPSSIISIALGEQYQGRTLRAYMVVFDSSWTLIGDPLLLFAGRMDTMTIVDSGETAEIVLTAESRAVDLERIGEVLYYTDEDQQRLFPGDLGMRFTEELVDKTLAWGRVDVIQQGQAT